jgi:hypothetical protein
MIIVDHPLDPVPERDEMKDQEPDVKIEQSGVRQPLRLISRMEPLLHLISTTILPPTTRSARKPHSDFTVSYTGGIGFCHCAWNPASPKAHRRGKLHKRIQAVQVQAYDEL